MDITEAIICQHLYCSGIKKSIQKEVSNCDTFQHTKWSNIKYDKLPIKVAELIPRNKLCVDIIGSYMICINGKKYIVYLKDVTLIKPIGGRLKILSNL